MVFPKFIRKQELLSRHCILYTTLFLLSQFVLTQEVIAQRLPKPETITVDNGLSFRRVNSIIQDHSGLMWFGTSKGLSRYDGNRFVHFGKDGTADIHFPSDEIHKDGFVFRNDSVLWVIADYTFFAININNFETNLVTGIEGKPLHFLRGENQDIWLISDNEQEQFLWRFTEQKGFTKVSSVPHFRMELSDINQDNSGNLWWSSTTRGLQKYDSTGTFQEVDTALERLYFHDEKTNYTDFFIDSQNRFFVYAMKKQAEYELWQYFPESGRKVIIREGLENFFLAATEDSWGNIWFGLDEQLLQLKPDGQLIDFTGALQKELDYSVINTIFQDRTNVLWIGTNGGLLKMPILKQMFKTHFAEKNIGWGNSIRGIGEYQDGELFFFSNTGKRGFYRINKENQEPEQINFGMEHADLIHLLSLSTYYIYDQRRNCIWTMFKSLMKLDLETKTIEVQPAVNLGLFYGNYNPVAIMPDGKILIGNILQQLALYHPETGVVNKILKTRSSEDDPILIRALLPEGNDRIWVATENNGIYLFNLKGETLRHYHTQSEPAINNNQVLCLHLDEAGDWLWFGTFGGGMSGIHLSTGKVKVFLAKDGLPNNNVVSILGDGDNLWVGTYNGLSCFNKEEETFQNFYEEDGLSDNEFNFTSAFKSSDGQLHFGGMNGINSFYPQDLVDRVGAPPLKLTRFSKHDQKENRLTTYQKDGQLKGPFIISPNISYFQFEWTLPNYLTPHKKQYYTWLEGLEEGWTSLGNTPSIRFNKLPAGNYKLHLKGKDSQNNWSELPEVLSISVIPPWWNTWWAYGLFLFSVIAGLTFLWKRESRRLQLQNQLEAEYNEAKRLRSIDKAKARFFANISHEFRTPLTVISGITEQMESNPKEWFREGITMIKRNTDRLLDLVNKMLDLSKLESGKMELHRKQSNIIAYLKYLAESIHSLAESKKIKVHFLSEEDNIMMDFDPDKIQQVMVNLLSNAIKFTLPDGDIYVSVRCISKAENGSGNEDHQLQIKVKDTGVGIPEDQIPYIFDRFYQVDDTATRSEEGTGIGLALVMELIKLMEGSISVKSKLGKETEFTIILPIRTISHEITPVPEIEASSSNFTSAVTTPAITTREHTDKRVSLKSTKPRVLLVEDNPDVVAYIAACLQNDYTIYVGKDGQEGIDIAVENIPDLIITDVMMPLKDGYELCQTIKSDERTSHIPIIMLTAKADMESRLEGLEMGADAYLNKPFHKKELIVRIKKLLELRKSLQKHFLSVAGLQTDEPNIEKRPETSFKEDLFIQKLTSIVESHLDDLNFTVDHFCKEIGMSHSQLHRKITALTGLSPNKFIRYIRLEKAKALLLNPDLTINMVAYSTGFNGQNYFGRMFKSEFGLTPMQWRKGRVEEMK